MVGAGFGPSSGRFAEVCESQESRLITKTHSVPPSIAALAFVVAFLGAVAGMSLIHLDEVLLGATILVGTVVAVGLMFAWVLRERRAGRLV